MKKKIVENIIYVSAAAAIVLAAWSIGAVAARSEFVLPDIGKVLSAVPLALSNHGFWSGLCGTLVRSVIGYAIAVALFLAVFFLSTASMGFARVVEPIISLLRSLPAVAITLVLILALGGNGAPILLGVIVIFPILYSGARARTATIPLEQIENCKIFGANKCQTFCTVYFPCLAGGLPDSLSSAFSYNIKAVIGAEILAQTANSLGMLMKLSQILLQPSLLIAFVAMSVIIAVGAEAVIRLSLRRLLEKYF